MYTYRAILVRVVDADTVYLDVDLGFRIYRGNESYRLGRIDAPELSTEEGKTAKAALASFLLDKVLLVTTAKADKYGRYLIELFADGLNVNDWLVTNGYAIYRTY